MSGSRKPSLFCAEFLLLCALAAALASQRLPAQEVNPFVPPPAMFAAEGFIRLDASVTDRSDHPVTGLAPGDFTLLDNGQPAEILSFRAFNGATAKPDAPTEVILVFDYESGSEAPVAAVAHEIGESFQRVEEPLSAPVSIVRVSKQEALETPHPSTDGVQLARAMEHPHSSDLVRVWPGRVGADSTGVSSESPPPADLIGVSPGRFSQSSAGLPSALKALGAIAIGARRTPGRKLLFWIGPGWSGELKGAAVADWIAEYSTRLREARITLYCATGLFHPIPADVAEPSLKNMRPEDPLLGRHLAIEAIAQRSGGGALQSNNLAAVLSRQLKEANDYYSLTFAVRHTSQIDEYHELKLEVDKPGLTASTNAGYFDEPVYYDQAPPVEYLTIAQLEQMLSASQQMSDRECAQKIAGVELIERMSSARLRSWLARMPGSRSRSALEALADLSEPLDPPPDEVVAQNPPDPSAQRQMLAHISEYLNQAIPRLPDFFALRTTVLFHPTPVRSDQTWKTAVGDQSLHATETTKTSIVLRHGRELVEKEASRKVETLKSEGAFGPILSIALTAATSPAGKVKWLRWERDANGPLAVFSYSVASDKALFETGFCCLADSDGAAPFTRLPAVQGEFAIDPASGAILRITVAADLDSRLPLDQSVLVVEYGRLTIGGNVYICPVRSVSYSRLRTVRVMEEWGSTFKIYGPFETILNDMTFEKYHLFHSNVNILPGFTPTGNPQ